MRDEWLQAVRREEPEEVGTGTGSLEGMPDGWPDALRYAELVTGSGHAVTDAVYDRLTARWDDAEIVEITAVIGLFAYFNRFNDALRVPVTR